MGLGIGTKVRVVAASNGNKAVNRGDEGRIRKFDHLNGWIGVKFPHVERIIYFEDAADLEPVTD